MKRLCAFLLLVFVAKVQAANYYVTQSGAGAGNGTSLGNAWSVASYNASSAPTAGDTVYFSGTITSTVTPGSSGTGTGANRLTLDFSSATLSTALPRIAIAGRDYLLIDGGGSWTAGSYTAAGIISASASGTLISSASASNDVTISGFQFDGGANGVAFFLDAHNMSNWTLTQCNVDNVSHLAWSDGTACHDGTISYNYARTSENTTTQSDVIVFGDAYNMTFIGNKLINRSPGNQNLPAENARHNDVFQSYRSGAGSAANPYGWLIAYNWIESNAPAGDGSNSWCILEAMLDNGATPALKMYGNVFVGASGTLANNGIYFGDHSACTLYFYNNTVILSSGAPGNALRFLTPGTLYARNNVCYDTASSWDGSSWTMTAGATWDFNFFYNWQTPSATLAGANGSRTTDPLFNNAAGGDYSLSALSTLLGAGDDSIGAEFSNGIAVDAAWPNPSIVARGVSWDVGAFQVDAEVTAPDAPTSPTATATSAYSITVGWTDNDDDPDETSFRIERSLTTSTGFAEIGTAAANATSYVDSNLTPGTTYYYRVRARNAGGDSAYTAEANATTNAIAAVSTSSNPGPVMFRR